MPKKRYTPEMEAARRKVAAAHRHKMEVRAGVEERVRLAVEKELVALDVAESMAANEALEIGVTGTDVIAALGIGNWHKYRQILALTERQVAAASAVLHREPWTVNYDGETKEPVSITFWKYQDKASGIEVDGEITFPVEQVNTWGGLDIDTFAKPAFDLAEWGWIDEQSRDWGRGHNHKPESVGGTAPKLAIPAPRQPQLVDDDYFTPKWDPSMDEEDA